MVRLAARFLDDVFKVATPRSRHMAPWDTPALVQRCGNHQNS